jgi:nitrogen regulatory protein P-II 1
MTKIEAIIQPGKFSDVRAALEGAGYPGITITEVKGHGKQKGITHNWFGKKFKTELIGKIKLEIVVVDDVAEKIVKAILVSAQTGQTGDGKIFVHRINQAYKISSGEEGDVVVG